MNDSLITIDGTFAEGGGQILRTALAIAGSTGCGFRITGIRAKRRKPGLMRQHLAAVRAATETCDARTEGATPGSTELSFRPGKPRGGDYRFAVGTAGSAVLVLQTVIPILLHADKPSTVVVEGGTHNPLAPPFDFLEKTWVPALAEVGARVSLTLEKAGFAPAGGGRIRAEVTPWKERIPFAATAENGATTAVLGATAHLSALQDKVGEIELATLRARIPALAESTCEIRRVIEPAGPGNLLTLAVSRGGVTTVFSEPGEKGLPSEAVAHVVADAFERFAESPAPVDEHLADQLLPILSLGVGGEFDTSGVTPHFTANAEVIARMLPDRTIRTERLDRLHHRVVVSKQTSLRFLSVPRS